YTSITTGSVKFVDEILNVQRLYNILLYSKDCEIADTFMTRSVPQISCSHDMVSGSAPVHANGRIRFLILLCKIHLVELQYFPIHIHHLDACLQSFENPQHSDIRLLFLRYHQSLKKCFHRHCPPNDTAMATETLHNWIRFGQCALRVREFLDEVLPQRWIGRGSLHLPAAIKWPPRSPDLTSCDNSLWGIIKQKI
ncbi:hypothetical protein C0J52_27021, partial [Blattella germanica]